MFSKNNVNLFKELRPLHYFAHMQNDMLSYIEKDGNHQCQYHCEL